MLENASMVARRKDGEVIHVISLLSLPKCWPHRDRLLDRPASRKRTASDAPELNLSSEGFLMESFLFIFENFA